VVGQMAKQAVGGVDRELEKKPHDRITAMAKEGQTQ